MNIALDFGDSMCNHVICARRVVVVNCGVDIPLHIVVLIYTYGEFLVPEIGGNAAQISIFGPVEYMFLLNVKVRVV